MCNKAVGTCPFVFYFVPDRYVTQEICDKVVSKEPFMLKYHPNRYKTQEMYNKAVETYPSKFVPDGFVTSKTIEKLDETVFPNGDSGRYSL